MKTLLFIAALLLGVVECRAQTFPLQADADTLCLWACDVANDGKLAGQGQDAIYLHAIAADGSEASLEFIAGKEKQAVHLSNSVRLAPWKMQRPMQFPDDAITIDAWVNPDSGSAGKRKGLLQYMKYKVSGFRVGFDEKNRISWSIENGSDEVSMNSETAIAEGTWTHIAVTYDGRVMRIYINGALDSTRDLAGGVVNPDDRDLVIGYAGGRQNFSGSIDGIRISRIARENF